MPGIPSTSAPMFSDRVERFTSEAGAQRILNLALGWDDKDDQGHVRQRHPPKIQGITHLYLEWDPSSWSEFQDDAYATALTALGNSYKTLKLLSINILGQARFTENDYVVLTPELKLPRDLLKKNMPEICSKSAVSHSRNLIERPSIDLQCYGTRFHRSRKNVANALLSLRNIHTVRITGPMEINLRRRIFQLVPSDPQSPANQLNAGLAPPRIAERTEMIRAWEQEMMTIRLGEDVVRICTNTTADDEIAAQEDKRVRDTMYGARKAGLTMEGPRLSEEEKEWVLPTSRTARVVIGWRAAGRVPAWNGPGDG
ncbi:MAG: hypothetical protein Q9165_003976 [Trypethelium subeluteriae]